MFELRSVAPLRLFSVKAPNYIVHEQFFSVVEFGEHRLWVSVAKFALCIECIVVTIRALIVAWFTNDSLVTKHIRFDIGESHFVLQLCRNGGW